MAAPATVSEELSVLFTTGHVRREGWTAVMRREPGDLPSRLIYFGPPDLFWAYRQSDEPERGVLG